MLTFNDIFLDAVSGNKNEKKEQGGEGGEEEEEEEEAKNCKKPVEHERGSIDSKPDQV